LSSFKIKTMGDDLMEIALGAPAPGLMLHSFWRQSLFGVRKLACAFMGAQKKPHIYWFSKAAASSALYTHFDNSYTITLCVKYGFANTTPKNQGPKARFIPAWGNAPGLKGTTLQLGLKARSMFAFGAGFQPFPLCRSNPGALPQADMERAFGAVSLGICLSRIKCV
jgi:hypothetical protein